MNALDCCCSQVHLCTCNWDDGGNATTRRHLDANYAFPIHLGKSDAHGECIHQSDTSKVAVQGICMVALAPNYIHNAWLAAIAVPSVSIALSAVAAFAVLAAAEAVPVHQHLQSDQIRLFVLLTSCQVELAALTASQHEMMWKM